MCQKGGNAHYKVNTDFHRDPREVKEQNQLSRKKIMEGSKLKQWQWLSPNKGLMDEMFSFYFYKAYSKMSKKETLATETVWTK